MNVLVLSRNYPNETLPQLGPWVEGLVRHCAELCEVKVVAPVPYCPPLPSSLSYYTRYRSVPKHEWRNGVEVWHPRFLTGPGYVFHSMESVLYRWGVRSTIKQIHKEFPFDLIHAHFAYPDGVVAAELSRQYNVPFLITEHAIWTPWMNEYPSVRRKAVNASRESAFHLAASERLEKSIVHFTEAPDKLRRVPIGFDSEVFTPRRPDQDFRRQQVLYVGRPQFKKGLDVLAKAMRRIVDRIPGARLVVVGGSFYRNWEEEEEEIHRLIGDLGLRDRVNFVGVQPHEQVAEYMRSSSVLVLPSRRESFGTVLVEALGCGTPVVATRCGGPEDIVNDEVGVLVPTEDPDALAEGIMHVLQNRSAYDEERIHRYALESFAWDRIAQQTVRLYHQALGRSISATTTDHS